MEGSVDDLKVVYVGTIYRDYEEWALAGIQDKNFRRFRGVLDQIGVRTSSTVTYVNSDGLNILIDPGYDYSITDARGNSWNKNRVLHNLRLFDIDSEDIDEIFITHWHADHWQNISCFPNARISYAGVTPGFAKKRLESYNVTNETSRVNEKDEWHTGMKLIPTPGHGKSDYSVAIRFRRRIFVVAGDIITTRSFYHNRSFWPNERMAKNLEQLRSSYDRIVEIADVIIPGHDVPFNNYLKPTP